MLPELLRSLVAMSLSMVDDWYDNGVIQDVSLSC